MTGVYWYEKYHRLTSYTDPEGYGVYEGGSYLSIFGIKVYENTYYVSSKTGEKVKKEDLRSMEHNAYIEDIYLQELETEPKKTEETTQFYSSDS
jgi:hypothetical protein